MKNVYKAAPWITKEINNVQNITRIVLIVI